MMEFFPPLLLHFLYVVVLSFLVGLELKTFHLRQKQIPHLGSVRTYTFAGILGFVLFMIDRWLYLGGFVVLGLLYLAYYIYKLEQHKTSIVSFMVLALVYTFGPLYQLFDIWVPTLLFVLIVFILNSKKISYTILPHIDEQEFETLGKFLLLSAVILPILPNEPLPFIHISPFKLWLVVVVVSAISYGSYIAQKYIFKERGLFLTGILGGLYSSTATTIVMAKKALEDLPHGLIDASVLIATAMMYVRLLILAFIFSPTVAMKLSIPMGFFTLAGVAIALFLYRRSDVKSSQIQDQNPLELGVAFLFALLFIAMMLITNYVYEHFGNRGIDLLSFVIGFTDIDPFVLSLLAGKVSLSTLAIAKAILIASGSNDLLKAIYALSFSKTKAKISALWLVLLGLLTITYPYIFFEGAF